MYLKNFLLLFFFCFALIAQEPEKVVMTIFIHGTVGSFLHVHQLHKIMQDKLSTQDPALAVQRKFRNHPLMEVDQLASARQGLQLLEHQFIKNYGNVTLPEQEHNRAWYHLAAAFDTCAKRVGEKTREYALFGWSGVLSNRARKEAGLQLYDELIALRELYYTQGKEISFELVAHSHGGNVCLWLQEAECTRQKKLSIESLSLLGSPIQSDTLEGILSPLFKTIISFYADGDYMQKGDYVSAVKRKKSFQKLSDIANIRTFIDQHKECRRHDVKIKFNGKTQGVDHVNLFLSGRGAILFEAFDRLPFVAYMPLCLPFIKEVGGLSCSIDYALLNQQIRLTAHSCKNGKAVSMKKMHESGWLFNFYATMQKLWQPYDAGRHQLLNKKNWRMFVESVKEAYKK